ncbi:MAG: hypothetical protein ACOYOU_04955 [Kiritimatiellia bacterium]
MKYIERSLTKWAAASALLCLASGLAGGCFSGRIQTDNQVEVKPIHITIDVNVHVQKDLDNFFGEIDKK